MKICKKSYHGYENRTDDYNLIDINKYSREELLEDDLVITNVTVSEDGIIDFGDLTVDDEGYIIMN